jgi:hypothetical protein
MSDNGKRGKKRRANHSVVDTTTSSSTKSQEQIDLKRSLKRCKTSIATTANKTKPSTSDTSAKGVLDNYKESKEYSILLEKILENFIKGGYGRIGSDVYEPVNPSSSSSSSSSEAGGYNVPM